LFGLGLVGRLVGWFDMWVGYVGTVSSVGIAGYDR
jgi:hypothetical protein